MHVRVRLLGKPDAIVVVESKLTKIEEFRRILEEKFDVKPQLQCLLYGGKMLEDGYTFHDYNIKLNDVIQLMIYNKPKSPERKRIKEDTHEEPVPKIEYKDAVSNLYEIGNLIDMKDNERGAWFEGRIVRIVHDPNAAQTDPNGSVSMTHSNEDLEKSSEIENDVENKPPADDGHKKGPILRYFTKGQKKKKKQKDSNCDITDTNLLYVVVLDGEDDSEVYCKLKEIRPRARTVIPIEELTVGRQVMINHNVDEPHQRGYWYDFKVNEIKKLRTNYELVGTLYLGQDSIPQDDTKVKVIDKVFAIEEVVPLHLRTDQYKDMIQTVPEKRSLPLRCTTCGDDEGAPCRDCGCRLCAGKEAPDKIVLCDECDMGYHMACLSPALDALPSEEWYCPTCRRDPHAVVAPGAATQQRKRGATAGKRDWGRGMACVGKTRSCAMPANHFGAIPGVEVGMCWRFRIQLSESGVHRPPVSGIHGRDVEGAYSIVLSGGYEDDVDNGFEFTYTGSGGRDLSGNKRTAEQSCDQTLTRENKALARNCASGPVSEQGGDAGDAWRDGKPVRVVRSYKMKKHFPKYAPLEGIRYDGIYKVVKYYPERGLAGYRVWKYLLRRDDPSPAPWEKGAKRFPIVYPDGYLEAEAEKKALKEKNKSNKGVKKRALREPNRSSDSDDERCPPAKRSKPDDEVKKRGRPSKTRTPLKSPKSSSIASPSIFDATGSTHEREARESEAVLSAGEREAIEADTLNRKQWTECLDVLQKQGKKVFIERVTETFLCIICQEVAAGPVTTPCLHNFCMVCLSAALSRTDRSCPCCRRGLEARAPPHNLPLRDALRTLLPGYDAARSRLHQPTV